MRKIEEKSPCAGCLSGCARRVADGPVPGGLNGAALLVYGVPLAALIAGVVGVHFLGTLPPLWALVAIAGALFCACTLVVANGRMVQARIDVASDLVRITK